MFRSFIAAGLLSLIAILIGCADNKPHPQSSGKTSAAKTNPVPSGQRLDRFPVLEYTRDKGDQILLHHEMTADESKLFQEMDRAVASANNEDNIEADYAIVERIGAANELTRKQSIAFWTRTTFSLFEPEQFTPSQ